MTTSNGISHKSHSNGNSNDPNGHHNGSTNLGVLHSNNHANKDALLAKIGGKQVLHQAVDDFYERLVTDPRIQPFFRYANVQVLKWHQYNLMSIAFHNVPLDFDVGTLILQKHKYMFEAGLDETTYDIVLEHFADTLRNLNVSEEAVLEALHLVRPLRDIFEMGAKEAIQRKAAAKQRKLAFQLVIVGSVVAMGVFLQARRQNARKI